MEQTVIFFPKYLKDLKVDYRGLTIDYGARGEKSHVISNKNKEIIEYILISADERKRIELEIKAQFELECD